MTTNYSEPIQMKTGRALAIQFDRPVDIVTDTAGNTYEKVGPDTFVVSNPIDSPHTVITAQLTQRDG